MTIDFFVGRYPYVLIALLMVIGVYGMMMKPNLLKKVIGMTIFQTAIYLLYIQGASKTGATVPVRTEELGNNAAMYINPLPHVIVLTAIVVGVAITGVALSLLLLTHRRFGTLNEVEILRNLSDAA